MSVVLDTKICVIGFPRDQLGQDPHDRQMKGSCMNEHSKKVRRRENNIKWKSIKMNEEQLDRPHDHPTRSSTFHSAWPATVTDEMICFFTVLYGNSFLCCTSLVRSLCAVASVRCSVE